MPSSKKAVVTKEMTFGEVLQKHPECAEAMLSRGMHCCGCHMAASETIEQGAVAHGMPGKEIDDMVKEMNKIISKKK